MYTISTLIDVLIMMEGLIGLARGRGCSGAQPTCMPVVSGYYMHGVCSLQDHNDVQSRSERLLHYSRL